MGTLETWAETFRPAPGEVWCLKCGEVADAGARKCLRCGSKDVELAAAVLARSVAKRQSVSQ